MSCPELLRTQAFLDGELGDKAAAEIERHLENCPDCQAFSVDIAGLSDAIRRRTTCYWVPAGLRDRISAALDAQNVIRFNPKRRTFWFGAASGAFASAIAAGFPVPMILPPSAGTLVQSVTDAHTQALTSGRMIQVASSSHHTVKPWFAGRVPVSPPVADLAEQGFPLVGGRIDTVAGSRAAVVVYDHGRHKIDLFVWADRGSPLPRQGTQHGYHSTFWKAAISILRRSPTRPGRS
jgi:anti-sigma factor RsiW